MNQEWNETYGGDLELWDMEQYQCVKRLAPIFNRAVLFETSEISYHGHPTPLALPPGMTRKSLSVYYYTVERGAGVSAKPHNTLFRNTQGLKGALKVARSTVKAGVERITHHMKDRAHGAGGPGQKDKTGRRGQFAITLISSQRVD